MKKIVLFLLFLLLGGAHADEGLAYFLGMRNNHYAFVGVQYASKYGLAVENSVFTQGVEKQYVRIIPMYLWELGYGISGAYSVYGGIRYDQDYYDLGARLDLSWQKYRYFQLVGVLSPFYDSFLKNRVGYQAYIQSFLGQEVALFAGIKNLPDFRDVERRYIGGLVIKTGNVQVRPELSMPMDGGTHLTRVSIFFVYKNALW